jgi:hypothetical protein
MPRLENTGLMRKRFSTEEPRPPVTLTLKYSNRPPLRLKWQKEYEITQPEGMTSLVLHIEDNPETGDVRFLLGRWKHEGGSLKESEVYAHGTQNGRELFHSEGPGRQSLEEFRQEMRRLLFGRKIIFRVPKGLAPGMDQVKSRRRIREAIQRLYGPGAYKHAPN